MLRHDAQGKRVAAAGGGLAFSFDYAGGLRLSGLELAACGAQWLPEGCEPFALEICGKSWPASALTVLAVNELRDETQEGVSFELALPEYGLAARLSLLSDGGQWEYLLQLGAQWPEQPQNVFIRLPLLGQLGKNGRWRLSANPFPKPDGSSAMVLHQAYPLPDCCIAPDQKNGLMLDIRSNGEMVSFWDQCKNYTLLGAPDAEAFENIRLQLVMENQPVADVVDIRLSAVTGGWPEVWRRWADGMRRGMDLSAYKREDMQWLKTTLFQYWDFAYSAEVFDYKTGEFDPDRLIDDGLEFGGFDAILHWYVYPRLGVDARSQWQFSRDIPGGYAGMRAFCRRAHKRGVRVFLPYNPWDARPGETPDSVLDELTRMVAETDVDGIFFDTMDAVPPGLRQRLDAIRPGIAFCTEGTPADRLGAEQITCSLDQKMPPDTLSNMPECSVYRYLFPESNGPFTSRLQTAEGKDEAVSRAVFNGTGLLLWQDVFGAHLPYSKDCRARIRRWKQILLENLDVYTGPAPVPLCDVLRDGLYLNRFQNADGSVVIWSLYNAGEAAQGPLFRLDDAGGEARELWRGAAFCVADGVLSGRIESRENLIFRFSRE